MPWTAGCFVLGAAAISGLPPLNGFVSEWLVYLGLFDAVAARGPAAGAAVPAAILLGMTGALALACFVKVCGIVFLGAPRSELRADAHEGGWRMRVPMLALAALCLAIGLAPALLWPAVAAATRAWRAEGPEPALPASLVTLGAWHVALVALGGIAAAALWQRARHNGIGRAVTWDCGYAAPTSRMQYTAGSFAGIITGWFAWILRPQRHSQPVTGFFPARASHEEHTPETVLERVVAPAAGIVLLGSAALRRLQHGRLQAYILYLVVGLLGLALLVFAGGAR
jgi:hydrogenase-4 component B